MCRKTNRNEWKLARFIVPSFPVVNIFTRQARRTTSLGLIMVATSANRLCGWRAEVIDENNYSGPRNNQGFPDHKTLQRENPAKVVGFYCGLSSTIERVWKLAEFYHSEKVFTIAGGWHAHYCSEETLRNNIDIVVHGDGEGAIRQVLNALKSGSPIKDIPGISFLEGGQIKTNPPEMLELPDLNDLPFPDFGLLRHGRMKTYPLSRTRGCGMNCEFCSVKGKARWASGQRLFKEVEWLVETRKACRFFIVDDRLEEDLEGTIEFFRMVYEKYGNRLKFTVQIRLEAAKNIKLLEIMKMAGVRIACIGYESPIDEELKAMRKGYQSAHMLEWTKTLRRFFWIHGMFMVGYPLKEKGNAISVEEKIKLFKKFIKKASLDTIQVLHTVPIVGTALRERLEREGRIFPLEVVPWSKYDGSYACFMPDDMTLREFQEISMKLMGWFYSPSSFFRIPLRTVGFLADYLIRGWRNWHRDWTKDIVKYGGYLLIQRWRKKQRGDMFIRRLEKYRLRRT